MEGRRVFAISLVALAVGFLAALLLPPLVPFIEVDRCLDAGGMYDNDAGECIHADVKR